MNERNVESTNVPPIEIEMRIKAVTLEQKIYVHAVVIPEINRLLNQFGCVSGAL